MGPRTLMEAFLEEAGQPDLAWVEVGALAITGSPAPWLKSCRNPWRGDCRREESPISLQPLVPTPSLKWPPS